MAEVVKTGLLAGQEVWTLDDEEMMRACAAFKAGVVLSDPYETRDGGRWLNLGHTFAHALEAGSGYARLARRGGGARAARRAAALRAADRTPVEELLRPEPVEADLDAAWAALKRDKKGEGVPRPPRGARRPVVDVPDGEARAALEALVRR